jgi:hypothetical protein
VTDQAASLQFVQLPVDPDQGLPQAISSTLGSVRYDFGIYANIDAPEDDPPETLYDLASPGPSQRPAAPPGHLVLRVVRPGPTGPSVILLRKLVPEPDLVHYGAELAFKVTRAVIARGNLNGRGQFGSQVLVGVAQRWA